MEIQNQTGAHIHIARAQQSGMNGSNAMDDMRRVTVSGSLRSVEAAQQLIRSRVHLAMNGGISPQPPNFSSQPAFVAYTQMIG